MKIFTEQESIESIFFKVNLSSSNFEVEVVCSMEEETFDMPHLSIGNKEKVITSWISWVHSIDGHTNLRLVWLKIVHFHWNIFKAVTFNLYFLSKKNVSSKSRSKLEHSIWISVIRSSWLVTSVSPISWFSKVFFFFEIWSHLLKMCSLLFVVEIIVSIVLHLDKFVSNTIGSALS